MKKIYLNKKRYNNETIETDHFFVECATFDRRGGFAHEARITTKNLDGFDCDALGVQKWYNRTWEDFRFCEAIKRAIDELPEEIKQLATVEIVEYKKAQAHGEAEDFLKNFKNTYNLLSEKSKNSLKNININTMEQGRSVLGIMKMMAVLDQMSGK